MNPTYRPNPTIPAHGTAGRGYDALLTALTGPRVVLVDTYHAPGTDHFLTELKARWDGTFLDTRTALKDPRTLEQDLHPYLTDDPVFGRTCDRDLDLFLDPQKWLALCRQARHTAGPLLIAGPGALAAPLRHYADLAVIAQVPRETVFNSPLANLGDNEDRGSWPRYKRSFYIDWPVQNRHQFSALSASDIVVDFSDPADPRFARTADLQASLAAAAHRPFRVRSLFMPGVWGGTRLRELIPDLPKEWPNCAWGFEVVGPENTITLDFADAPLNVAFDLLMHQQAHNLLGHKHHRKFGDFFPIRFDFLDTIGGTNLSCQVHPDDAYINAHFREPFAQTETYYIMESTPEAQVFLGLTETTSRTAFENDVKRATHEGQPFAIETHVNAFPSREGDLFLIPPGTVHCSGAGNLVLEISATPYIYTFKLYDYLRADLDGKPRPISYERAFEVLDFTRTRPTVEDELIARPQKIAEGPGWTRHLLADHPALFHIIERLELTEPYEDTTADTGVHVLCVVKGPGVTLHDETDLRYAETIIIPAAHGPYRLTPQGPTQLIKCYLR